MKNIKWKEIVICFFTILSMVFVPSMLVLMLSKYSLNPMVITLISDMIFLGILFIVFYKDIIRDIKVFFNNFNKCAVKTFKWYILGVMLMVCFNLVINSIMGAISDNETLVRAMIYKYPSLSFVCVALLAPLIEEIVFRKSVIKTTKNKWIGSLISGLLFGLAHVFSYLADISNLIYILPYFSLGFTFAMMDYESDSVFSSVMYHAIHNAFSFFVIIGLGAL